MQPKELRSRRLAMGWTPAQLAAAVGVTSEDVRAWDAEEQPIHSPRLLEQVLTEATRKLKTSHH
jgi:transcriptional regulator with XRE-family HTH domain